MEGRRLAIEARNLTKSYGAGRGVFDVSFGVERGEVFGFLGPNGAGKTVTMRHLMGFIRPQSGRASIMGMDCFKERARIQRNLGYLPGEVALMGGMTAGAYIDFIARMKGVKERSSIAELEALFGLDRGLRIKSMSKGNRQKVGIVCAFMGNPEVLLLDEPTSGLDPLMQEAFIDLVGRAKERGATVLLSSHILEEVTRTCDRVAFIKEGRIAAVRSLDEMEVAGRAYAIEFASREEASRYREEHGDAAAFGDRGVCIAPREGIDAFVKDLASYRVENLESRERTLEDVFIDLYAANDTRSRKESL